MTASSADLLNEVFLLLSNDATFLNFKGLAPTSPIADKVAYIVKEEETDSIVTSDTIPIVLLYSRPGHKSQRIYTGKVVIDCFAKDGNTSSMMTDRTNALMTNWKPPNTPAYMCDYAYDTSFKTGIPGVKGHRIFFDVMQYNG